jgi:protein tyrosine phosphatase
VHCSAGIGRTGTTIALANIILQIAAQANQGVKDPQFSVFSTVRRLREQRFLMVQMEDQYMFIHDFLEAWLTQSEDALALLGGKAA